MSTAVPSHAIDENKMNEFLGKVVGDFGAALSSSLVYIGQKLGLYQAMTSGPVTPAELAERTSTNDRYIREWLINQAAGGYVNYEPTSGRYSLSAEQAVALTDENTSDRAAACFGANTILTCSLVPQNFSAPVMRPISLRHGFPR